MFVDDWAGLVRVGVVGTRGHPSPLVPLRVSGRRTLATANAFDFVVTVAWLSGRSHTVELETDGSMSILTEVPAVLDHAGPDDLKDPRP